MGILNITPDSFSNNGMFLNTEKACIYAEKMIEDGADIIDIGGESTRPGSDPVSLQEELDRVMPVLERVISFKTKVSIDTTKAEVAREALRLGAEIVNDISGLQFDETIAHHV
ncbi:MAG: dihydropteroate synthase, partial [Candidatus Marinimicrobia bacterium]|nr:dihydropteroate synthase [Candidatus Neomarinimicrobiota bacterium]